MLLCAMRCDRKRQSGNWKNISHQRHSSASAGTKILTILCQTEERRPSTAICLKPIHHCFANQKCQDWTRNSLRMTQQTEAFRVTNCFKPIWVQMESEDGKSPEQRPSKAKVPPANSILQRNRLHQQAAAAATAKLSAYDKEILTLLTPTLAASWAASPWK